VNDSSAAEKVLGKAQFLVDQTQQDTTSPLHVAATEGHTDVAKVLIVVSINVTPPPCVFVFVLFGLENFAFPKLY